MPAKPIAGTLFISADGLTFSLGGSATTKAAGKEREGLVGLSGYAGLKEKPQLAMMEFTIYRDQNITLDQINQMTDVGLTLERADGSSFIMPNAFSDGYCENDEAEGEIKVTFRSASSREVSA